MYIVDAIIFLDAHAGAITGMATVLLVGATMILAYLNYQLWLSQDKPILDFTTRIAEYEKPIPTDIKETIGGEKVKILKTGDVVLYVRNIGKGPAFDIRFRLPDLDLTTVYYGCLEVQGENKITVLPGFEYEVTGIVYKDMNGRKIKQKPVRRTSNEFSKMSNEYSKMKF